MFWRNKKSKTKEFKCSECKQVHSDWPALTFKSPKNYHNLTDQEKMALGKLDADFCEIHYEDQIDHFIRVTLTQKVNDTCENLEYGLWVSLSEKSYSDYKANFDSKNHETGYFGWLCSSIPEYEDTMSIPCDVMTKTGRQRPEIFPHQDFDHPFIKDYYDGISISEAERRIEAMLGNVVQKENWSEMTSFSNFKLLSKYMGELRFGPAYLYLKSEPVNIFGEDFFGDWFYRTENGVFLQKWNFNPMKDGVHSEVDNDLIFYDLTERKIETIETNIKSFHWKIEKDSNGILTLVSNNGEKEIRMKITSI